MNTSTSSFCSKLNWFKIKIYNDLNSEAMVAVSQMLLI